LFKTLNVYQDDIFRSAAMNMAIDEALLDTVNIPSIRFYQWNSPALSFGYFEKFANVVNYAPARDLVRRWTGGGIVLHGDDLTYSIVIPSTDPRFAEKSMSVYEAVHRALCKALAANGAPAVLSADSAVADRRYNNCFANPVRADVMMNGQKIAGAAQRRTRRGLLQQGSIQGIDLDNELVTRFAQALSQVRTECSINDEVLARAKELTQSKYGTEAWLRKR
jgi:lipoate-protein ligase A